MKKIVITGGLGYIGMELCKIYSGQSRTKNITVIDNKFHSSRVEQLKRWGIKYRQIDILDSNNLNKEINDADIIYHLAGISDVATVKEDININHEKLVFAVGVEGTRNIINLSSESAKIVFPSTHVIFEGLKKVKFNIDETHEPSPVLDYAKGKLESENDLIKSNKNFVILRLGSLYGKSFDSTRLNIMPNLFAKISSFNGKITLYSGGKQLKSLVSINDVVRCMEFVGENKKINKEIFNCVNENLSVKDVADLCKKINKKTDLVITDDPVPNEGYTLTNKKIRSNGFKFLYNVEDSFREMIESWSDQSQVLSNEIIESGADEFVDERGIISAGVWFIT